MQHRCNQIGRRAVIKNHAPLHPHGCSALERDLAEIKFNQLMSTYMTEEDVVVDYGGNPRRHEKRYNRQFGPHADGLPRILTHSTIPDYNAEDVLRKHKARRSQTPNWCEHYNHECDCHQFYGIDRFSACLSIFSLWYLTPRSWFHNISQTKYNTGYAAVVIPKTGAPSIHEGQSTLEWHSHDEFSMKAQGRRS